MTVIKISHFATIALVFPVGAACFSVAISGAKCLAPFGMTTKGGTHEEGR